MSLMILWKRDGSSMEMESRRNQNENEIRACEISSKSQSCVRSFPDRWTTDLDCSSEQADKCESLGERE